MPDIFKIAERDAQVVVKDIETLGEEIWNFVKGAVATAKTGGLLAVLTGAGQLLHTVETTAAADVAALEGSIAGSFQTLAQDVADFNAGKPVGIQTSIPFTGPVKIIVQKGTLP